VWPHRLHGNTRVLVQLRHGSGRRARAWRHTRVPDGMQDPPAQRPREGDGVHVLRPLRMREPA
jgi:hypothetical protein